MVYLSTTSFWFSINSSYTHCCHLSKRLGMSPQDYEYLLVAANLAHFHERWGLSIKKFKWNLFIDGHHFSVRKCIGTFEIDSKTMDLNSFINGVTPEHRVKRNSFGSALSQTNLPEKLRARNIISCWCHHYSCEECDPS